MFRIARPVRDSEPLSALAVACSPPFLDGHVARRVTGIVGSQGSPLIARNFRATDCPRSLTRPPSWTKKHGGTTGHWTGCIRRRSAANHFARRATMARPSAPGPRSPAGSRPRLAARQPESPPGVQGEQHHLTLARLPPSSEHVTLQALAHRLPEDSRGYSHRWSRRSCSPWTSRA